MIDSPRPVRFLDDFGMDFAVRCLLTGVRYGMAEPGEILQVVGCVEDGDAASWMDEWLGLADRLSTVARDAEAAGHRYSAWEAQLRAANYTFAGNWYAPAAGRDTEEGWRAHRARWDAAVRCWPSPAGAVEIPYAGAALPGYWFDGLRAADEQRPVVVVVNGIETPMSDATMTGLADGVARGYRVLCFDGPGQGAALYDHGLELATDWDAVLAAVVEFTCGRPGVDRSRITLMGVAEGGLFAAAGAAGHSPVAALVLDPPVSSVQGEVLTSLPGPVVDSYGDGSSDLDEVAATIDDPDGRSALAKARAPLPRHTLRAALDRYGELVLSDGHLDGIACATYCAIAENAESYAGQGAAVAAELAARGVDVTVDHFTAAEGAGLDCEILASQVRNQRVYDWLGRTLEGAPG